MKFCDIQENIESKINIIRDCNFEHGYLVGKPFDESIKLISYIGDTKYIEDFLKYDIAGVICTQEVADELTLYSGGVAVTDNPKTAFFEIHNYIAAQCDGDFDSIISEDAVIHERAIIADKNVKIGANTSIAANVIIKEGTVIGDNCIIREGCVLGSPAFYYYGEGDNRSLVQSSGGVLIGNNVELHTTCIVEKGVMFGNTIIGDNTKIDNGVIVGHDTQIGRNCTVAGNALFAGSVIVEQNSFIGVSVAISPGVRLGHNVKVSSGAIVTKNVPEETHVSGNFAIEHDKYVKHIKAIGR